MASSSDKSSDVDPKTIQLLAKGVMELYEPPLATISTHLKELTERQQAVLTMLVSERRKLDDVQYDVTVDAMLADIATGREKLTNIASGMNTVHRRMQNLMTRASNVEKAARLRHQSPKTPTSHSPSSPSTS